MKEKTGCNDEHDGYIFFVSKTYTPTVYTPVTDQLI